MFGIMFSLSQALWKHSPSNPGSAFKNNPLRFIPAFFKWIEIYHSCGSISKAALKCGIARSTLQRWIKRQSDDGEKDLEDKSKRPHKLALQKIDTSIENLVLKVR